MNRIQKKFKELQKKGEKALVAFITAGDPDLATTHKAVLEMEKAGANLIELGVPFSDPMADGPVIQRSSERALQKGVNLAAIFKLVKGLRKSTEIPIVLMGYFNPILQLGCERFCEHAAEAGVDGVIVVDLPPEEAAELHRPSKKAGLSLIYLLTPTSNGERIEKVKKLASGFVYYVSMTGITGAKIGEVEEIERQIQAIKKAIPLPVCVGFGIRTPDQAKNLSKIADGVVVGSGLVELMEKGKKASGPKQVAQKVASLKKAMGSSKNHE
ncbi:MAG: tryptophan synthase subunit alpha [bacterium]